MVALANFKCSHGMMQIKNIPVIVESSITQNPLEQKQSSSCLYLEPRMAEAVRTAENKPGSRDVQPWECQEATPKLGSSVRGYPQQQGPWSGNGSPVTTQETDIRKGLKKKNMRGLGLAHMGQFWGYLE